MSKKQVSSQEIAGIEPNADLSALHRQLISLVSDLESALSSADSTATVDAVVNEISEVNHRVTMVGRLLFSQQTEKIRAATEKVNGAIAQTKAAIKKLESIKAFATAMTTFLALVDKAIDIAKLFAV